MSRRLRTVPAAAIVVLALTGAAVAGATVAGFTDVDADRFYAGPVQWAKDNHITTGRTPTSFAPDAPVTRGEVVTFLKRFYDRFIVGPAPSPTGGVIPGDGVWLVGGEITPGTYRTVVPATSFNCYFARLSGLGGSFTDIIQNDNWDPGATVTVAIAPTDVAFESDGCGTWVRIAT